MRSPGGHPDVVDLGSQVLARAVGAHQPLLRHRTRLAAEDAPGLRQVAVVVDGDLARLEHPVDLLHAVAAPVPPRSAGVRPARVSLDEEGVVALQVLRGDVLEEGPPGVSVHAVADGTAGNAPVEDLHELEGPSLAVHPRVEEVGAGPVPGRGGHVRSALAERAAEHVELARKGVGARAERGGKVGVEQRALGQGHVDEVVEAVVEEDLGVEHHDHVDPDEHLEHAFVEVEVDRARRPAPRCRSSRNRHARLRARA